jgi:hypothetical protein
MVLGYVLTPIRAASFHHVDRFIGQKILGLRWNWVLEMSGISLVLLTSQSSWNCKVGFEIGSCQSRKLT